MGLSMVPVLLLFAGAPAPNLPRDLALLLAGASDEPQLVVLPLEPEGVKAQVAIDAWKVVVAEVGKARGKLRVGTKLQGEIHDFLVGPARERAKECGANLDCLREIGSAIDAGIIIAGKVSKDAVLLLAIEVPTGQKLATARSPASLAGGKPEKMSRAAAAAMIGALGKARQKSGAGAAALASKDPAAAKPESVKKTEVAGRKAEAGGKRVEPVPPRAEPGAGNTDAVASGRRMPDGERELAKAADDLKVDDRDRASATSDVPPAPVSPPASSSPEGSSGGAAAAGRVSRTDRAAPGSRAAPGDRASSPPPPPPPSASAYAGSASLVPAARVESEPVTGKWWFWTAIGAAVLGGAVTAIALAGGAKGGPSKPSDLGTITGTY